jgi:hypothetical protein
MYIPMHLNWPRTIRSAHGMCLARLALQTMFLVRKRVVLLLLVGEDGRDERGAAAHSHVMSIPN